MWLGSTPLAPYTKDRVHPQGEDVRTRYGERPGWLRIEHYCLGMITGWGSHHVDIAHWGMDTEHTGPHFHRGPARSFPKTGLWNVHGPYHIEMTYANGVTVIIDNKLPNGVRFEGSDGWIFVTRGAERVTSSDPDSQREPPPRPCRPASRKSSAPRSATTTSTSTRARTATTISTGSPASRPASPQRPPPRSPTARPAPASSAGSP